MSVINHESWRVADAPEKLSSPKPGPQRGQGTVKNWRRTRKNPRPMPEILRQAAVSLSANHSISQISRELVDCFNPRPRTGGDGRIVAARGDSNHWVVMDDRLDFDGCEAAADPMELLLFALGGCTCMWLHLTTPWRRQKRLFSTPYPFTCEITPDPSFQIRGFRQWNPLRGSMPPGDLIISFFHTRLTLDQMPSNFPFSNEVHLAAFQLL